MKKFDHEYEYAIQHPNNLKNGDIIRKTYPSVDSTELNTEWYKVKIRHDVRIFEQISESEVNDVTENIAGDYMLNIRTGYISIMLDHDQVSVPLNYNSDVYADILEMLKRIIRYDLYA